MAVHQRVYVLRRVPREALAARDHGHEQEGLHCAPAGVKRQRVGRPVALGHFAGRVARRGQADLHRGRPESADPLAHNRVAAVVALAPQLLEHPLRGDVRVAPQELADRVHVVVELARAPRRRLRRQRRRALLAHDLVPAEQPPHGVARYAHHPRDRTDRKTVPPQRHRVVRPRVRLLRRPTAGHGSPVFWAMSATARPEGPKAPA